MVSRRKEIAFLFQPARRASMVILIVLGLPAIAAAEVSSIQSFEFGATTDFMHARYYSPNLGRFVSVDPVGGSIGSSQSWNRYAYVMNNPVALVDPTGKTVEVTFQNAKQKMAFLTELQKKTGLTFDVSKGNLHVTGGVLKNGEQPGSATARDLVRGAIASKDTLTLNLVGSDKDVGLVRTDKSSREYTLDMDDFATVESYGPDPATMDSSMAAMHEMVHAFEGLDDPDLIDNAMRGYPVEKGDVVNYMNTIRSELGLDPRRDYRTGKRGDRMWFDFKRPLYFTNK